MSTQRNATADGLNVSNDAFGGPGGHGGDIGNRYSAVAIPLSATSKSYAHMPRGMEKLEKMARQSLLHELWQEQQRTHEFAVDWLVLFTLLLWFVLLSKASFVWCFVREMSCFVVFACCVFYC